MAYRKGFAGLLSIAACAAAGLPSCAKPTTGPKLIDADGVQFTACGGVTSIRNDGNSKDPETMTYDVLFTDPAGSNRHLAMVRSLTITDLPSDSAACAAARSPTGSEAH